MLDLVVANALIVDGRGTAPFLGSLGVRGDRIVWIRGGTAPPDAARTIDGDGLVLAPGFIDVHNHSDLSAFVSPDMPSAIRQGVTTVIVGNCGTSPWPLAGWVDANRMASGDPALDPPPWESFGDYLDATDAVRPATNIAALVGHGAIRQEVMGLERRPPSRGELRAMRRLVDEAMGGRRLRSLDGPDLRSRDPQRDRRDRRAGRRSRALRRDLREPHPGRGHPPVPSRRRGDRDRPPGGSARAREPPQV